MQNSKNTLEVTKQKTYKGYWLKRFSDYFPLFGFLIIVLIFAIMTTGSIFNPANIRVILKQSFLYIVGGLGVIFCYAQGAHDFSLAANIAVSAIIGQKIGGESVWLTIAVSLLVGSFVGAFNGILYAVTGLSDFILTLSVNFLISGALISKLGKVAYAEAASGLSTFNNIGL